ncbi:phage protein NinX family protein [Pseudomonas viridiflava]|uniref:phage protein NinX family protein n=1 Tax=Pseudomonas viridiflava TaxID=33069 RepID=UPI002EC860C4|nr:phage protein NinX family protein [Pseudomonas viridiflava]
MSEFSEVKTEELSGEALNWAVAIAESLTAFVSPPQYGNPHLVCVMPEHVHRGGYRYSPSTDWSQVGPLIHKYQIEFCANSEDNHAMHASLSAWRRYGKSHRTRWSSGQDHLIAACRAIVASVLGETVSVPKELLI